MDRLISRELGGADVVKRQFGSRYALSMSGRKQHYIPQFIQAGFAASFTPAGMAQVYVYRKGADPHRAGVAGVFAERDFYGGPEDPTLDNAITDIESHLSKFVHLVRKVALPWDIGASGPASELVHQSCIRARWLRDFMARALALTVDEFEVAARDPNTYANIVMREFQSRPSMLEEKLEQEFRDRAGYSPARNERRQIKKLAAAAASNRKLIKALHGNDRNASIEEYRKSAPGKVADGHKRALLGALGRSETEFRQYIDSLKWCLLKPDGPLLLGDCGALFFGPDGNVLGPMGSCDSTVAAGMMLPLGTRILLIGYSGEARPVPTAASINVISAGWSNEAFIASYRDDTLVALHAGMGSALVKFLKKQTREAFDETIAQADAGT